MAKKRTPMSAEQRQAFAERMKLSREKRTTKEVPPVVPDPVNIEDAAEESTPSDSQLRDEVSELKDMMLKLLMERQGTQSTPGGIGVGVGGRLIGEIEKYTIDPNNYLNPTIRLREEPRLKTIAFDHNYELDYEMTVRPYENKAGANMKEPEFTVQLNRVVLDDQGNQTDKRYIARRMVFHEDPQAAVVIAREQGIDLDVFGDLDATEENKKLFLNEMRYLRVKTWLFDVFWPRGTDINQQNRREEVVNGTIVQVFNKPVGEDGGIDFDKIKTVFR